MTTISYDGKIVAADTMSRVNERFKFYGTKAVHNDTHIAWIAGEDKYVVQYLETLVENSPYESTAHELFSEVEAFLLEKDTGEVYYCIGLHSRTPLNRAFAIGTGGDFAIMAMSLGQNAVEAIKTASKFDCSTCDIVEYWDIEKKEMFQTAPFPDVLKQPFAVA